jgi:NitT/TauT family transport system substrate-binding protein
MGFADVSLRSLERLRARGCPTLEIEMTPQTRRHFTRWLTAAAIFGSLLTQAVTPALAQEKVTILLDYAYPEGIQASLHLATAKGWYKEAGLDVEVKDGKGSIVTVQQIAAGQADIGLAQLNSMAGAIANGLPVVSIMAFSRKGDNGLVVARDSGINTVADFKGKKLVSIAGGAVGPLIEPFLRTGGLTPKDVTIVIVDGSALASTYTSGGADGIVTIVGYFLPTVEKTRPSKAILFSDVGLNLPGYGLLVNKSMVESRPAVLRKIVEINQRAWAYIADGHQVEGADAIVNQRASLRPDRDSLIAQVTFYANILNSPGTEGKPLGWQSADEWQQALNVMAAAGILKSGLKPEDMFTNQFTQ